MKCTMLELELMDGSKIKLTLNFARLLKVKNYNKKLYEEYMHALKNQDFDVIFDSLKVIYVAYLCANSDKLGNEELMSEEELMEVAPMDIATINNLVADLIQPKKK